MNCTQMKELISGCLDRSLDEETAGAVRAHLASCGACRRENGRLRNVKDILARMPSAPLPQDFYFNVQQGIARQSVGRFSLVFAARFAGNRKLACAAALFLLVLGAYVAGSFLGRKASFIPVSQLVSDHIVAAGNEPVFVNRKAMTLLKSSDFVLAGSVSADFVEIKDSHEK